MAGYRKRNGKWEVRIRRNNSKNLSKTFINKEDAQRWAREQESKLDKGDFKALNQVKKLLREEYKNTGGDWISAEEKKLANINQSVPSEINFKEFSDITKSRIFLEKLRNRNIEVDKNKETLKKKYLKGIPSILGVNE